MRDGHGIGLDVHSTLAEAGVVGLWQYRLGDGLVYCDAAMASFYGVDLLTAVGGLPPATLRAAIHPHDLSAAIRAIEDAIARGVDYRASYRVVQKGASARWIRAHARPLVIDGQTVTMTGVNILTNHPSDGPLDRLADASTEAVRSAKLFGDPTAIYLAKMLALQTGKLIASELR